ncbi:MAG: hypothetical protein ACK4RK_13575 [Gemmataceae bacterium]
MSFGRVPLNDLLHTGRFAFEQASAAPGWLSEPRGEHVPDESRAAEAACSPRS